MRLGSDPRGFWNEEIGDVFSIRPWEMGRVRVGEYVVMHAHAQATCQLRAAMFGLGGEE